MRPERVIAHIVGRAERPPQAVGPLDDQSQALLDALCGAMMADLTPEELAEAERALARTDQAYVLFDRLLEAAARRALDLQEVEDSTGQRFFVLITDSRQPTHGFMGEVVGRLLIGDEARE